jgi:peptidoglycan/LPS O-acetylase OafA/YrhL
MPLNTLSSFSPNISKENGFDVLRLFFAFSVFIGHFGVLTPVHIYWPVSPSMGVAGFFIISGFLITRSYYRSSGFWDYAVKRIRRIVPAYFFIVIASALLLSFVSSLSLQEYFTSKDFYQYLAANLSFLNFIQPTLPGVFTDNLLPFVNGSLWTIKVELALYTFLPFLALFLKRKIGFVLFGTYMFSLLFYYFMSYLHDSSNNALYLILRRQFLGQIRFFVAGVIVLFYFDFIIERNIKWFLYPSVFIFLLRYVVQSWIIDCLFPLSFAVLIIWFAYYFGKLSVLSRYGDFSYGFYLFHFPIIQVFVHSGWFKENPVLLLLACFGSILLLSCLSWHLLEKHILKRKSATVTNNSVSGST